MNTALISAAGVAIVAVSGFAVHHGDEPEVNNAARAAVSVPQARPALPKQEPIAGTTPSPSIDKAAFALFLALWHGGR